MRTASRQIELEEAGTTRPVTLMDLVDAVSEVAETEQEVLATVDFMVRSGRVRIAAGGEDMDAAIELAS